MSVANPAAVAKTSFQEHIDNVIAGLRDHDHWLSLAKDELLHLLYHGLCTYGMTNDESVILYLMPLYRRAMEIADGAERMELYVAVKSEAEQFHVSLNALLPFLLVETDDAIVSTATIDIAMIGRPSDDDPLSWPVELVSYIERGSPNNRGAVFAGLVLLGDRRVNVLLNEVKWTLTTEEINMVARRRSGFPWLASFEFWLAWCEELMELRLGESAAFGGCASALALLVRDAQTQPFMDIKRNFGYMCHGEGAMPAELLERIPTKQVGQRFSDRLYALEAREEAPKVMSHVLVQYGLESQAALGEGFVIN